MAAAPTINEAITRLSENENRIDIFTNQDGFYLTNETVPRQVESLPSLVARIQDRYLNIVDKGDWTTSVNYVINDVVKESGIMYLCVTTHIAGVFATDLAANKWVVYQGDLRAADVANSADALKGAGMVGYEGGLAYADGSVGAALNERLPEIGNYAGLDSYAGDATAVLVYGVQNISDGGHGVFRRTTDTPAAANGIYRQDALGRWWKRDIDDVILLSWFAPDVTGATVSNDVVQSAVNSVPNGGELRLNGFGTILIDTLPSVKIESDLGSNWLFGGILIDRPIKVTGSKSLTFKIKDFSTAWAAQDIGDSICAFLITASDAHVDGLVIDANANNHYEISGAHKWWEVGPTLKRPPCGISISVARTQNNVKNVLVENCTIYNPLAGISFIGNAVDTSRAAFLAGTLTTGVVKDCVSRNNRIYNARGNGVLFNMGVDNCVSDSDVFVNGMYHAIRMYSRSINCKGINCRSHVNCDEIVARYNSTDLGYWRTTDSANAEFKVTRTGYHIGGADSYSTTYGYSVVDCGFSNCELHYTKASVSDTTYFNISSLYNSSFSTTGLMGSFIKDCRSYGAYYGVVLYSDGICPSETIGVDVGGNTIYASWINDIYAEGTKNAVIHDNTAFVNETINYASSYLKNFTNGTYVNNSVKGTPLAGTYGVLVAGVCDSLKVSENQFSATFSAARRYAQEAGSTPALAWPKRILSLVSADVISGGALANGWASAYGSPAEGQENQLRVLADGSFHLRIALSGVAATANTIATLASHLRPSVTVGFIAHNRTTGAAYWGRVLTDGRIQINLPAFPSADSGEVWADATYTTLL